MSDPYITGWLDVGDTEPGGYDVVFTQDSDRNLIWTTAEDAQALADALDGVPGIALGGLLSELRFFPFMAAAGALPLPVASPPSPPPYERRARVSVARRDALLSEINALEDPPEKLKELRALLTLGWNQPE